MPLKRSGGPFVGLDIGSATIKACEIDCRGGKAYLRAIAQLETPSDVVVNGEIVNPVTLGKAIRQVLNQHGIKARKVVSSVSAQSSLVVRIIEVPKMTRAELADTMRWEVERHVPFAAEQVVMDYEPLVDPDEVPEGQNMEVLLAVVQEDAVMRHIEVLQAAGLQPLAVDIEPLATARACVEISGHALPASVIAIADLGASKSEISIYREGKLAFTRSIQLAGNHLTRSISDVLQRPLAEAEQLKLSMASIQSYSGAGTQDDMLGGADMGGLDFGFGDDAFGAPAGADPGAATATGGGEETQFDIAGGGFTEDAFTSPTAAVTQAEPAAASADNLFGPAPQGNPFDPAAEEAEPAPAPAEGGFDNPFGEVDLFGSAPTADPFAPAGADAGLVPSGGSSMAPAAMSEEEYLRTQVGDAINPVLAELLEEVRRSLDFYRNRANGLGAQSIVLVGGTARLPGLADYLSSNIGIPVAIGNPLSFLTAGSKLDAGYLEEAGPYFGVAVGLATRELIQEPPAKSKKRR